MECTWCAKYTQGSLVTLAWDCKSNMNTNREHECDVLVVGSGAAGLSLALRVANHCKVMVLSK